MSVIQNIRDKYAALIIVFIAISLIAFILMDGLGSRGRSGSLFASSNVGKVNGTAISRTDFETEVERITAMQAQQMGGRVPPADQIREQVWQMLTNRITMDQQCTALGIDISSKELDDLVFGANPPQWLSGSPEFKDSTGAFDAAKARNVFRELRKQGGARLEEVYKTYIDPLITDTKTNKYSNLLSFSYYVPKWMAEKQVADNNALATFSYVYVPYATVNDTTKITDEEISTYINKNKAQFKQDEYTRGFNYISFDATPSKKDTIDALNSLRSLKNEFLTTTDIKTFFNKTPSELPYADLYLGEKQIQQPVKDSLFRLSVGQSYGPYIDGSNYVMARMIAKTTIADTASVRHILISTHDRDQSGQMFRVREDSVAKKIADSVENFIKSGANWDSICIKYSGDEGSKAKGGLYENNVPNGGWVPEFSDFAFTGAVGERKMVKTMFGYHYMEVVKRKGSQNGYKIAYLANAILVSADTENEVNEAANAFAAKARTKKAFVEQVLKIQKSEIPAAEIKQTDAYIGGLGESRELVRWIFEGEVNDVSEPIKIANKYIIGYISSINKKGLMSVEKARPMVEQILLNERKAKIIIDTKIKGTTLEAIAAAAGATVAQADSVGFANGGIPNIGAEPKIIGAAFNKNIAGKLSTPIAGNTGVFVVKGLSTMARPGMPTDLETTRKTLEQQIRTQGGYRAMQVLQKAADIKDNRFEIYN
jgi:peptidyl-prolyl cis-trans isomerase D